MAQFFLVVLMILLSGCANDSLRLSVKGEVTTEEFARLESAARKWCDAGLDCVTFTRDDAPDTFEIVSEVSCDENDAVGCTSYHERPLTEYTNITVANLRHRSDWLNRLESLTLHELGHYIVNSTKLPHIKEKGHVMSARPYPVIDLTPEDIAWVQQVFQGREESSPAY